MERLFTIRFGNNPEPAERKRIVGRMVRLILHMESGVERDMWLKSLSQASGVSENMLRMEMERADTGEAQETDSQIPERETIKRIDRIARRMLVIAFRDDSFYAEMKTYADLLPERYRELLQNTSAEQGLLELEASYSFEEVPREELEKEFKELVRHLRIEALKNEQKAVKMQMTSVIGEAEKERLFKRTCELAGEIDMLRNNG